MALSKPKTLTFERFNISMIESQDKTLQRMKAIHDQSSVWNKSGTNVIGRLQLQILSEFKLKIEESNSHYLTAEYSIFEQ